MMNPHKITAEFEKALCEYTSAPYAVAVDNCSNALFLALYYELNVKQHSGDQTPNGKPVITIPRHTYPAVPAEIIHAGGKVEFVNNYFFNNRGFTGSKEVIGAYQLLPTSVWDSALRFTCNMYLPGQHMCLSFTGPFKHLKLGKGGAILTDDVIAYRWFKRARFSGRQECSYHEDDFDKVITDCDDLGQVRIPPVIGWNFYMPIETAARGLHMMPQFYDKDGKPKHNEDLCLPYPDLSRFKLWQ